MYLIDSHCHLNILQKKKKNIKNILQKAYSYNIKIFLTVAISISDYKKSFSLFKKYPNILYSCGIHPLHNNILKKHILQLQEIIKKHKHVIALGETGLDFYKSSFNKTLQIKIFQEHIRLSIIYKKPIIIHTRNSEMEIINILSQKKFQKCTGVIHSFTGDINFAKKILDLGFYISLSGIITFKNASYLQPIIKFIPLNKLLIETDSPYLSPEPKRGKCNNPAYLLYIAKYIAKIKGINLFDLSKIIQNNFNNLFNIKKYI
ncbi:Uncharacterized metal-dependent hydrolase YcfH [Buchnera aphidicola (Pterocallis alni)]|uniref:TatD family hydrolase n=1 Tax=Buchnera aphidicola TaxID=9 RepID=UPI003463FEFB